MSILSLSRGGHAADEAWGDVTEEERDVEMGGRRKRESGGRVDCLRQ